MNDGSSSVIGVDLPLSQNLTDDQVVAALDHILFIWREDCLCPHSRVDFRLIHRDILLAQRTTLLHHLENVQLFLQLSRLLSFEHANAQDIHQCVGLGLGEDAGWKIKSQRPTVIQA